MKLTLYDGLDHSPAIVKARSEPGLLDWLLAQRHDGIMRNPVIPTEPDGGTSAVGTVTLEMMDVDAAYEGKPMSVALFAGDADCRSWASTTATSSGEATVAAGACEISIPFVPAGSYTACAFVDADGNLQPSPGDLAGQLPLVVTGDAQEIWSASDWIAI